MKLFRLFIFFFLFLQVVFGIFPPKVFADCGITMTLRVGSKGVEVECLQKSLNLSGSFGLFPDGNFGPLTQAAVQAFQSNNRLVADGIVGPLSRAVLNGIAINSNIYPSGCVSAFGYSPTTGVKCDRILNPSVPAPVANGENTSNPDITNLDKFIETVVEVNRENGKSKNELDLIADTLRKTLIENNIDYEKQFEDLLKSENLLSINQNTDESLTFFNKIISKTLSFFGINPTVAQALSSPGAAFGGRLIKATPCKGSWMLFITPLPPKFVVLLSYIPGTQGFATYNIPRTTNLLGLYAPIGNCSYGTVNISTQGTILPMVGSSPL